MAWQASSWTVPEWCRAHVVHNQAVASVAVKLGSCDSSSLEAVVQWVERDVLESPVAHRKLPATYWSRRLLVIFSMIKPKHVVYDRIGSLKVQDVTFCKRCR